MTCGKCKYEFCWECLSSWHGHYNEGLKVGCPLRLVLLVTTILIFGLVFNLKMIYNWDLLFNIQSFLFYNISALIVLDLYIASFMGHVLLY